MLAREEIKVRVLELVLGATDRRIRPITLEKTVASQTGVSIQDVREALSELEREGAVVQTYRDPCSYVEIPDLAQPRRD
jgi:DNA-binding GntR family transcriptional regulator